jgi:glutamate synthase (NADPH/NADH) small chain
VYRLDYGQEEAQAIFGDDPRVYCMTARRFLGDEHGKVTAVEIVQVDWQKDDKGRFVPKEMAGTVKTIPCQLVLLAMGFLGPEDQLLQQLGIERDERTNIRAPQGVYATSIKGVFAAGDCRRGQSLVVWAFNEGRGAARECDRYLMGQTDLP